MRFPRRKRVRKLQPWPLSAGRQSLMGSWCRPDPLPCSHPLSSLLSQDPAACCLLIVSKMKNFKRRFSLSVPRTETIEESLVEFTEQFNQLHSRHNEGEGSGALPPPLPTLPDTPGKGRVKSPPHPHAGAEAGRVADVSPSQACSSVLWAETPSQSPAPSPPQTEGRTPGSCPLARSTGGRTSAASPWR